MSYTVQINGHQYSHHVMLRGGGGLHVYAAAAVQSQSSLLSYDAGAGSHIVTGLVGVGAECVKTYQHITVCDKIDM